MAYTSRNNTSTLPQGFSIYQPALGAQLQFLPAIGTPELDELINAYVAGSASTQEKRASVSLDFLEYAHVTGQTFKFYPVYSMNTAVESPATDSGYGSSFNVSPVTSNWDFSHISTSRSPPSQQARTSPRAAHSRHQATDFGNLPGMKIMTKDGRDVTNSASRGSKTKEQRDHAHLMRIIKACDNCKRKKIRCDPSHKKPQSVAKSTKKAKVVAQAVQAAATLPPPPVNVPVSAPDMATDRTFATIDLEGLIPSLSTLEPWEEFIDYPPADINTDYDFFNDPAGYFSPESASSSVSAYSTKPVTPTSQQELSAPYGLPGGETNVALPQLPFDQTEPTNTYVDFNLFSPDSNFSEDEHMVPIDLSQHLTHNLHSSLSDSPRSDQSSGGVNISGGLTDSVPDVASWSVSSRQSGEDESGTYYDPGSTLDGQYYSRSSPSSNSEVYSHHVDSVDPSDDLKASSYDVASRSATHFVGELSTRRGSGDAHATMIANSRLSVEYSTGDAAGMSSAYSDATISDSYGKYRRKDIASQLASDRTESGQQQEVALQELAASRAEAFIEHDVPENVIAAKATTSSTTTAASTDRDVSKNDIAAIATKPALERDVLEHGVTAIVINEQNVSEHAIAANTLDAPSDQYWSENAVVAPRAMSQPQNYCAPCTLTTAYGGVETLLPMMASAALVMASGSTTSLVEDCLTTIIPVVVALVAFGALLYHSFNGLKLQFPELTKSRNVFTGISEAFKNRARAFQSQSLRSTKSVNRTFSRKANLVTV